MNNERRAIAVRDEPGQPDPGFAELYCSFPESKSSEPWAGMVASATGPVLYLGVGTGRLAAPLARMGATVVGVDAHPAMLAECARRAPGMELHLARIEDLQLPNTFDLVICPSNILLTQPLMSAAARHLRPGGRLVFELINPAWMASDEQRHSDVVLLRMADGTADFDIHYPVEGYVQEARGVPMLTVDAVEAMLSAAGLRLLRAWGMEDTDLVEECSSYLVEATRMQS